jgi:hypothetical protein
MMNKHLCALLLVTAAGCVEHKGLLRPGEVASLDVQLIDPRPDALGSPAAPVAVKQATFNVVARDGSGAVVARDLDVDIFISFGGIKTGAASACGADVGGNVPIETARLSGGMLMQHTVQLPVAFGSTSVWIDERQSGATGASPTIYFRNALIPEVQRPPDLTATNATFCSPFNNKFLIIDHASPGGQLVVTSVFGDAFSVTDTGASAFNSMYVYAFGKPPTYIVEGRVITSVSGNYSKFVGFTELNFPLFLADQTGPLAPLPPPVELSPADVGNEPKMLSADASVVRYTGTICNPLPPNPTHDTNVQKTIDSWNKYNQFVLDNNDSCDAFTNIAVEMPSKVLGSFDPLQHVGETATFVGMLQNHSGQNPVLDVNGNTIPCSDAKPCSRGTCQMGICYKGVFNFWTLLPRRQEDVTISQ